MQIIPSTARLLGITNPADLFTASVNIDGGTRLLAQPLKTFGGNVPLALAGYHAGEAAVKRAAQRVGINPETVDWATLNFETLRLAFPDPATRVYPGQVARYTLGLPDIQLAQLRPPG